MSPTEARETAQVIKFTPTVMETRTDRWGQPFLYARGIIAFSETEQVERTVIMSGKAYVGILPLMKVGEQIKLKANRKFFRIALDGSRAFYKAISCIHPDFDESFFKRKPHAVKGHYRKVRYGPNNSLTKTVWFEPKELDSEHKIAAYTNGSHRSLSPPDTSRGGLFNGCDRHRACPINSHFQVKLHEE